MKSSKGKGFKTLIRLTEIFVVLLIVFYGVRLMIGRSSSKGDNFIEYISMYAGGPVKLFDMFIKDPVQNTGIWGKETFPSLLVSIEEFCTVLILLVSCIISVLRLLNSFNNSSAITD